MISAYVEAILSKLKEVGVKANIFKMALSGSCYIEFDKKSMGKLRVGDHKERGRYGYRWQLRTDLNKSFIDDSKGHKQYYYCPTDIDNMLSHLTNYYRKIND